ncbi:MAG: S-layer homology domain-containing protein, partial [Oscillospiraceae bacterium]|nr:S-layer homology domain-containing protein [Oscillospiraceae bacterium]
PEVTENPDGSTTETVTNKDGSVTETTTSKPVTDEAGNTTTTTTETVTNQDGSTVETVTETVKAADGATTETKTEVKTAADGAATTTETVKATDAAGTTATAETKTVTAADGATASVETAVVATISTKAVTEAAAEHNVPITLPVSVVAPKAGDAASTVVTVALPEAAAAESTVKVEVPVSNMTPGTVAVIVKADGTEEIMDTTMGKNGAVIALEGSVTVKIVDNSKQFKDLNNAGKWITDAADYTSARGFFNGTGDGTTFTPEGDATRGAFITVLHRMAKTPEADAESKFEDLKEGAFYTDAVKWAAANEIVMGGDGYIGADDNITREQMVVMLYRYAEHLGLDVSARADMSEYTDADDISSWATDAVSWARAHGLMTGGGDGRIAAKDNTNRAQIAAVVMRFCEFVLD